MTPASQMAPLSSVTNRLVRPFLLSVAGSLVLTALAKSYSATGTARILSLEDPLLHVNNRLLLVGLGLLELAIAACLFFARGERAQFRGTMAVLWLAGNFVAYRAGSTSWV